MATGVGGGCAGRPLPEAPDPIGPADAAIVAPPSFEAIWPCPAEADYATDTDTVRFGFFGTPAAFVYDPKGLAVDAGDTVTFSGSFASHPLYPSGSPGYDDGQSDRRCQPRATARSSCFRSAASSPTTAASTAAADDGSTMAGVIWAR